MIDKTDKERDHMCVGDIIDIYLNQASTSRNKHDMLWLNLRNSQAIEKWRGVLEQ